MEYYSTIKKNVFNSVLKRWNLEPITQNEVGQKFRSVARSGLTLCDPMDCSTPGFPVHHQLPELAQTHVHWSVMRLNHLILCRPLLLLPSIFPSIRVFSNESILHSRWAKYWASASVLPMNIQDWFPLGWAGWFSCSPRDSQESYPTPQFKSISSSVLSFPYSSALTSITWLVEKP